MPVCLPLWIIYIYIMYISHSLLKAVQFSFWVGLVFCVNPLYGQGADLLPAAFESGKIGNELIRSIATTLIWKLEKCISNEEISNHADI